MNQYEIELHQLINNHLDTLSSEEIRRLAVLHLQHKCNYNVGRFARYRERHNSCLTVREAMEFAKFKLKQTTARTRWQDRLK